MDTAFIILALPSYDRWLEDRENVEPSEAALMSGITWSGSILDSMLSIECCCIEKSLAWKIY